MHTNAHRSAHQAKSNISDLLTTTCAALVHTCTALQPSASLLRLPYPAHAALTLLHVPSCECNVKANIPGEFVHGRHKHTLQRPMLQCTHHKCVPKQHCKSKR